MKDCLVPFVPWSRCLRVGVAVMVLLGGGLLPGCGKPPALIHKYVLDYATPVLPAKSVVPEALKVDLFSVAQAINTPDMVYSPGPYRSQVYQYHRWRVNPGFLVTDYLLRDLRQSGLFKAVFSYDSSARSRFVLEGGVEDFQEVDQGDSWQGVLGVNLTLLDTSKEEITQKIVFQKNYRTEEQITEKTPRGLADAMSRAMQRVSGQIIADVHQAARRRAVSKDGS